MDSSCSAGGVERAPEQLDTVVVSFEAVIVLRTDGAEKHYCITAVDSSGRKLVVVVVVVVVVVDDVFEDRTEGRWAAVESSESVGVCV